MGVEQLKTIAMDLAKVLSAASAAIHGNLLALWDLGAVFLSLKEVDYSAAKAALLVLSPADRMDVEGSFNQSLDLVDKVVQAKIIAGESTLEDVISFAEKGYGLFLDAKVLLDEVRKFLGV